MSWRLFSAREKNDHLCWHQRKNIIPFVKKGVWKWGFEGCLSWKYIVFSSPKAADWRSSQNLCSVYDWISKSANVEDFFANLFANMSKENITKMNYWQEGKTITNCGISIQERSCYSLKISFCFDQNEQDFETHSWLC